MSHNFQGWGGAGSARMVNAGGECEAYVKHISKWMKPHDPQSVLFFIFPHIQ